MSQQLESSKYYQEPGAEELLADQKAVASSKNVLRTAGMFLGIVFWVGLFGGGACMVYNAANKANETRIGDGSGASIAMRMLTFCTNLVGIDFDRDVTSRPRRPSRFDRPVRVPDVDVPPPPEIELK